MEELDEIKKEIKDLKEQLIILSELIKKPNTCPEIRRIWTPRNEVMDFLDFGNTRISAITEKYNITTSEIGKRKYYLNASILEVLDKNKIIKKGLTK